MTVKDMTTIVDICDIRAVEDLGESLEHHQVKFNRPKALIRCQIH